MVSKFLVDADFLVGYVKEDDTNYKKAGDLLERHHDARLYITCFTIPETVTVLSHKMSHKNAHDFLLYVRKRKFIEILPTSVLTQTADEIFLSQKKKGTSWFDCYNVACVQKNDLDGILSFDKFYKNFNVLIT